MSTMLMIELVKTTKKVSMADITLMIKTVSMANIAVKAVIRV